MVGMSPLARPSLAWQMARSYLRPPESVRGERARRACAGRCRGVLTRAHCNLTQVNPRRFFPHEVDAGQRILGGDPSYSVPNVQYAVLKPLRVTHE